MGPLLLGLGYTLEEMDHLTGIKPIPSSKLPQVRFAKLLDGPFGEKLLAAKNQDWEKLLGIEYTTTLGRLREIDGLLFKVLPYLATPEVTKKIEAQYYQLGKQPDNFLIGVVRLIDGTILQTGRMVQEINKYAADIFRQLSDSFGLCPGEKLYNLFDQLIRDKLSEKSG